MATYSLGDTIFGYKSKLIENFNAMFPTTTMYTDETWAQGNAIMYDDDIAPMMTSNTTDALEMNVTVTSMSSDNTTGRVKMINSFDYPNVGKTVLTGLGTVVQLPFRCSEVNFTSQDVYTWMQNEADVQANAGIASLNLDTLLVAEAPFVGNATICEEGTGSECQYNLAAQNFTNNVYSKATPLTEANRCTSLLPLGGAGKVENQIDASSGLSTVYGGENNNTLSISNLMSSVPGRTEKIHLHPFISLRMLHENLNLGDEN